MNWYRARCRGGWRAATAGVLLVLATAGAALYLKPPAMLRVGVNYAAKIVCSNVFIAGRQPEAVLAADVGAIGHTALKLIRVSVDHERQLVRANMLGLVGNGLAVYRSGTGCATVADGDIEQARSVQFAPERVPPVSKEQAWPIGQRAELNPGIQTMVERPEFAGPGMRGLVVIHHGQLVGEHYDAGFTAQTPLLGWSMAKTVTAALVGLQIGDGRLSLDQQGFWPAAAGDGRDKIRLRDLLAMSSGLRFNEDYGGVTDVTRMLYGEGDMAAYAHRQPLDHAPGSHWSYSSGTTLLLSRIWQQAANTNALSYPRRRLFAPLGMHSAILEADASGTFVGSSYLYATTQDWARFAQFLLQDGVWNGQRLLPAGYVDTMRNTAPASAGRYGSGQLWRCGPQGTTPEGENPDTPFGLPADTFWLRGHDGQSIAIVPSRALVVVRLGLTPQALNYKPQALLAELLKTLPP